MMTHAIFLLCNLFFLLIAESNAWLQPRGVLAPSTKSFPVTPPHQPHVSTTIRKRCSLWMEDNGANGGFQRKRGKPGQIGGRKKRRGPPGNSKRSIPSWSIPALLLTFFLLKGPVWRKSDPSFVYYESSVYERRVYNGQGQVETSRRESTRSNIPGLVEQKRLTNLPSPEDVILDEMDQIMRRQEAILKEFF